MAKGEKIEDGSECRPKERGILSRASSGRRHTPSIAFRHLPPRSLTYSSIAFRHLPPQSFTCSERPLPAPSSTVTHTLRASLSGTFLHSHSHTLSIAFRHLPPDSPTHSEHRFPAPSSTVTHTLRASLSGTFLQTLPDLVTPLKGHSLSPRSCPPTRSAASQRFRY